MLVFPVFKAEVQKLLRERYGIDIGDCTDDETLKKRCLNTTPAEFVEKMGEKYDLERIDL